MITVTNNLYKAAEKRLYNVAEKEVNYIIIVLE